MHIPFNFGHTIEKVAMFKDDSTVLDILLYSLKAGGIFKAKRPISWETARKYQKPGGVVWGHFNPDLQLVNNATGCSMYFTPPKYWPESLAKSYFGNRTVFGMLRDPYERLVAFFRGNQNGYGGNYEKYMATCDVNGAVKHMMNRVLESKDKFMEECTFLPQAEYFDGRYGIKLPVDNRRFPESMNEVFAQHSYPWHIRPQDILHVNRCNHIWAGDLEADTKQLVRQVYARDFELLCQHFGYCDTSEDVCIAGVHDMCPKKVQADMAQRLLQHPGRSPQAKPMAAELGAQRAAKKVEAKLPAKGKAAAMGEAKKVAGAAKAKSEPKKAAAKLAAPSKAKAVQKHSQNAQ
mmetsp:Transcript_43807/g.135342  ORF Transcript_43807/g.135342 Transcript_43807/m.135342 type:complete len:349 (-) Transcript_43807:75-1121(-)